MTSKSKTSITNIQALRGVAALSVTMAHASEQFLFAPRVPGIGAAKAGVDIFFVISGFIMVFVTTQRAQTGFEFLKNRILRIVPNYWFYTFAVAILGIVAPSVFRHIDVGASHLLLSLFFIAHRNPAMMQSTSPLLRPGWTLNYEMFFYVLFALAMMDGGARRVRNSAIVIAGIVAIGALMSLPPAPAFYTRGIMLEFVFGMLLAKVYVHGLPDFPKPVIALAVCLAIMCLWLTASYAEDHALRFLFFGVPALGIVASSLMIASVENWRGCRLWCTIGDASYTLYLSHPLAVGACRVLFTKLQLTPHTVAEQLCFMAVASSLAVVCALPAYWYIELPLTRMAKSKLDRVRPQPVPASA